MSTAHTQFVFSALALLCSGCAAWTDLRARRIPNALTGAAVLAGLSLHCICGGAAGLLSAALACLIAGGLFLLPYIAGGMGAGDVKLMAALGAVSGLHALPSVLLATAVSGGIVALAAVLRRGALQTTFQSVFTLLLHHTRRGLLAHGSLNLSNTTRLRIPYAVPACMGCLYTLVLITMRGGR